MTLPSQTKPEIVITGVSTATPLALDQQTLVTRLLAGETCIVPEFGEIDGDSVRNVGIIPDNHEAFTIDGESGQYSILSRILRLVIRNAVNDAGLFDIYGSRHEVPVLLGSCYGSKPDYYRLLAAQNTGQNIDRIIKEEFYNLKFREDAVTCEVEKLVGFQLAKSTIISQCLSGFIAIALGISMIQSGQRDFAIVGAFDLFDRIIYRIALENGLLDKGFCKPFDQDHCGTNFSDGAGAIVIESQSHAESRGASNYYAKINGLHIGNYPDVGGPMVSGICKAMTQALQSAGISANQIDMISSHGTGIPKIDQQECIALKKVFKDQVCDIPITSYVPNVGYSFAASTFTDLAIAFDCMENNRVIGVLSPQTPLEAFKDYNFGVGTNQERPVNNVMKLKLSLNGGVGAMILSDVNSGVS